MEERIKVALEIIKHGGQKIFERFHTSIATKEKTRHDFVTEVDQEIEDLFDKKVRSLFPDDRIIGEENGVIEGNSGYTWVVDPLDGTNNFVKGIPQSGIQIAIYKNEEIVYGAILNPFVHQLYTAERGKGAFVEDLHNHYTVQLSVGNNSLEDSMLIYDAGIVKGESPSREIFNAFLGKVGWIRIFGVAVLDLPLVALGSSDLLVSNIPKPMDIAPGCLLIEEAGGVITDFEGKKWSLDSSNIVAGTPANHKQALDLVKSVLGG